MRFELERVRPTDACVLQVHWVHLQSTTGSFLVGPNHSPLVAILQPKGELTYQTSEGGEHTVDVFGGMVRVSRGRALVILDS